MKGSVRFLLICVATFLAINIVAFWCGVYERVLAPDSSTHAFDAGLARVDGASRDPARDVLVLGDSRIFSGFDAATADASSRGLHFINAGIPGTTPRCWYVLDRALDPRATRFHAVVIPLDTYGDDDSALGSIDGDDRVPDLAYVALRASVPEAFQIAGSFPTSTGKADAFLGLLLRGPLLRADVQNFVADPKKRFDDLAHRKVSEIPAMRPGDLLGLSANFENDTLDTPEGFPQAQLDDMRRQIFYVGKPSASYLRYRERWLAPIVERYVAAGVPVLFVRIPTRPLHRNLSRSLGTFVSQQRSAHAALLDPGPYVALEQPELFTDAEHLNESGAVIFSTMLGRDVAAAISKMAAPDASTYLAAPIFEMPRASVRRFLEIGVPLPFQSSAFFAFFAIVAWLYFATRDRNARRAILLIASWYFYARWNAWYLLVLLALTATDFAFGLLLERARVGMRRLLLAIGIAINVMFLGTAKYADFVTGTIAGVLHVAQNPWALHVLVPIGISFHTFQSISYLVDVYRGRTKAIRDPFDYALYLAFFPQLLAGPIVRAQTFFGELFSPRFLRRLSQRDLAAGATQVALGLAKKNVVADRFAAVSDAYFANPFAYPGAAAAWSAALAFALQIYFDFSGYSDIAIGLARILGFRFPQNFKRPYLAASPQEFWRRWHMTLSFWLRDYIYIPLGGNRHGTFATLRNLTITMLLGGLWHGANWTFVAWGGYHGALLACQHVLRIPSAPRSIAWRVASTSVTFALVSVGWVLFRATSFGDAWHVFVAMVSIVPSASLIGLPLFVLSVGLLVMELVAERTPRVMAHLPPALRASAMVCVLLAIEFGSQLGVSAPFIYFRF